MLILTGIKEMQNKTTHFTHSKFAKTYKSNITIVNKYVEEKEFTLLKGIYLFTYSWKQFFTYKVDNIIPLLHIHQRVLFVRNSPNVHQQ